MDRRHLIGCAATSLLLIPLAACVSTENGGKSARKSASAASRLAAIRKKHGLTALSADRGLETAAVKQAGYMAGGSLMEHDTSRGRGFVSRMKSVDTGGTAAENIAHGRFDTGEVLSVWMHSPPHRRNILDPRFSRFGLAAVADPKNPSRFYWAMVLGA